MTKIECKHEGAVSRAFELDAWDSDLLDHVTDCTVCSDLLVVQKFFQQASDTDESETQLPDPAIIWWRAQLKGRAAAADRATRIITLVQWLAFVGGGILAASGIARLWPRLKVWLAAVVPDNIPIPVSADAAQPALVMVASLLVLAILILYDAYEPKTEK
jgi:hypothetical protein